MEWWKHFRRYQASNIIIVFLALQLVCIVWSALRPGDFAYLFTPRGISFVNLQNQLEYMSPIAIMAIGVGMLMIVGEFDLSVGSTFALSAYVMALAVGAGLPPILGVPLAIVIGGAIGFMNGQIVIRTRIPSFIATLGSMYFLRGLLLFIADGKTQPYAPSEWFRALFVGQYGPIQAQLVWLILIGVIGYLLLERHKFGNHIYAVGGNRETAIAIGVNPDKVKLVCFMIVGVLSAMAGVISATKVSSISPIQGRGLELIVIAACVIGGTALTGGSGSIIGIVLGVAFYYTMENVLGLLNAGEFIELWIGIMIILTVVVNTLTRKKA